jgi:predicted GH43/DUF377 family glycosyl hydrolase
MEQRKFKKLQDEILQIIENYKTAHPVSRAVNVNGAFMRYARDIVKRVFTLAQTESDLILVMKQLEDEGLLSKTEASNYISPKILLDKFGWDRLNIKVDSSRLLQSYNVDDQVIKVSTWFNGSVCEFGGKYFMAYRMDAEPWTVNTRIAICELDGYWQPIAESNWLVPLKACDTFYEDPRLFTFNHNLYLSYADGCQIGLAVIDTVHKSVERNWFLDKPYRFRMEKNWTFFDQKGVLYCVYKTAPHIIYRVKDEKIESVCSHEFKEQSTWQWGWGDQIGGGSCPVKIDGKYYSFFHTRVHIPVKATINRQYHMGCYVFDPETFKPVAISKEPLMSGTYLDPEIPSGGKGKSVVFPMSAIYLKLQDCFRVTAGINDYEIWHIDIGARELQENLIWF